MRRTRQTSRPPPSYARSISSCAELASLDRRIALVKSFSAAPSCGTYEGQGTRMSARVLLRPPGGKPAHLSTISGFGRSRAPQDLDWHCGIKLEVGCVTERHHRVSWGVHVPGRASTANVPEDLQCVRATISADRTCTDNDSIFAQKRSIRFTCFLLVSRNVEREAEPSLFSFVSPADEQSTTCS